MQDDSLNLLSQSGAPQGASDLIKDSDIANFTADVIEASKTTPVIVDFWAPWCGPCKQLGPALEKAVRNAGGLVRMVKINVDDNQALAAQLRIQSVPTVYAFKDGQPVDGFAGALPESQIKAFLSKLIGDAQSPIDQALDQARALMDANAHTDALSVFQQILGHEAGNTHAMAGVIRAYTELGELDAARAFIATLAEKLKHHVDITPAISALELAEQLSGNDAPLDEACQALQAAVDANANDHQARLDLALALYGNNQTEQALEHLLEIVSRDRKWNDEAGRKQLLKILEALGFDDPLAQETRKRLSTILFS